MNTCSITGFSLLMILLMGFTSAAGAQSDDSWKVYDDTGMCRIDITIAPASLQWILTHVDSDSEHVASMHFRNRWIDEDVDSIGFRLRGATSRNAAKKSFKVSINSFFKGRRFHAVKKLNLNGEHNDPSIIRSKLCFDLYGDIQQPASRASHVRLHINGVYYGLYISVENIDEEFLARRYGDDSGTLWKCLYPADLHFISDDPAVYGAQRNGTVPVYELQTNEVRNDFGPLARLIKMLAVTPAAVMMDSLETLLDVPTVLKYFAMDVLVGGWDDYRSLMNNYYLYYMPSSDRFTLIPYDYDNTFGVDWFSVNWSTASPYSFPKVAQGARPMADAILNQNAYRDLLTHFLQYYSANVYALPRWEARIDRIRDTIKLAALEDTARLRDWHFTPSDFLNSYTAGIYQNQHVKFGLKQFINARNASLPAQLSYTYAPPLAYGIAVEPRYPRGEDSLRITASCFGKAGVREVTILFTPKGESSAQSFPMTFSPVAGSTVVESADRWCAVLPPLGPGKEAAFRIVVRDSSNQAQISPHGKSLQIKTQSAAAAGLVINELLADNGSVNADQNGEYDDWIEIYNGGAVPVGLTGKYLTDNPAARTKWRFTQPGLTLDPGKFLLVWCDDQTAQAGLHTNFKFSAGGEYAAIVDSDGVRVIDSLSFGAQTKNISIGRSPDGGPVWKAMSVPTPGGTNMSAGVAGSVALPEEFSLEMYPNPFNPSTIIRYSLPTGGRVTVKIYSVLGSELVCLVNGEAEAGAHEVTWYAAGIPSGVYLCEVRTAGRTLVGKLLLMK